MYARILAPVDGQAIELATSLQSHLVLRLTMDSDAALVLREAPVPVLLVRGHGQD